MPISQRLKKLIKSLQQKPFRDQNGLFLAEGEKLARELFNAKYQPELILIKESPSSDVLDIIDQFAESGVPVYTAQKHQFDQLCEAKSPQNILSVVTIPKVEILPDESFIALDGIADPGNVGTIIRTADWFGYKQVILGRDCADMYNPKTVRSTMGSLFHLNVVYEPNLGEFIRENFKGYKIFGASVHSNNSIESLKKPKKYGFIFGSESHGLSEDVKKVITSDFKIEGCGSAESLNVAIAAGICLYNFSKK